MKQCLYLVCLLVVVPCCLAENFAIPLRFGVPVVDEGNADFPLSVEGASHILLHNNWPAMPYRLIVQALPFGTRVDAIAVEKEATEDILLDQPLPFTKGIRKLSQPGEALRYDAFDFDSAYPSESVQWRTFGGLDPATLVHRTWLVIRVFPVQYQNEARLIFTKDITLTVSTVSPPADVLPVPSPDRVVEPFVVISSEALFPVLLPYFNHKSSIGLTPAFQTIESIVDMMPGRDDAEKLRNFIRQKVEQNGTAFVLLAGDADILPVRRCMMTYDPLDTQTLPMEAYFSDLYDGDGNYHDWDANGDGNFGDFIDDYDALDLLPDVFTSRIPASTPSELYAALNNVVAYETTTQPQDDWFNRVLFAAVDTFNEHDHGDTSGIPEGEAYAEFLANGVFSDRDIVRVYETETYPHDAAAYPENVIAQAEPGAGFMAFHCHGAPDCMYLTESCFTGVHAGELRNGYKLPVLFGFACSTAAFDNELPDWPYGDTGESMPEYFLLNPDGGAIAYVGATRVALASGYSHADYRAMSGAVEYHYFKSFDRGMHTPGMMLAAAHLGYIQHVGINNYYDFFTVAEYAQFGDPSVSIGGVRPEPVLKQVQFRVDETIGDSDSCLEPGETFSLNLALLNTGGLATDVTAVLTTADPELQILENTAEFGDMMRFQKSSPAAPFSIGIDSAATTGRQMTFRVDYFVGGVSAGGETVEIFLGSGPWLILDDWDIIYDSYKNGNADPGDHIMPSLFIRNIGCETAQNMILTASSDSPHLELCTVSNDGVLGDLPPEYCSESGWGKLELIIREDCPHNTEIPVLAAVSCDGGGVWELPFVVTVLDQKGPRMWDYAVTPRSALPEEEILILTHAYDVSGIESIHGIIRSWPDGQTWETELFDDGAHGDGAAGDGVFGAVFPTDAMPGNYIVDLESVDVRGNRWLIKEISAFSTIPIETTPVIVVNTSTDLTAADIVSTALNAIGSDHVVWDSRFRGAPDQQILSLFSESVVIWLFGWTNCPSKDVRSEMAAYLDSGGGLMISGWDLARNVSRFGGRDWLRQYFGVEVVNGDTGIYTIDGVPGNPVTDGLSFRLKKKNATTTFTPDTIQAVDAGEVFLTFRDMPDAAACVVTRDAGLRSMCLPFALEGIRTEDELQEFLRRMLPWMADRPAEIEFQLSLNQDYFTPGDPFALSAGLINPYRDPLNAQEYIVLAVSDYYWFWPSWVEYPPYVDMQEIVMDPFESRYQSILEFVWPATQAAGSGIMFFGALLDPVSGTLLSAVDSATFGFGP